MVNTKSRQFRGILLYRLKYRESDMLVKFMTATAGKKMFLVRRATKTHAPLASVILPFSYGTYEGVLKTNGLSYLDSGNQVHNFEQISNDIILNAYATYIMGLLDQALPDSVADQHWFKNLYYALTFINNGFDPEIITNIVEIQLLPLFGVAPEWHHCAACGLDKSVYDYSEKYGGLLCAADFALDSHRMHLDQRTIYYLRQFSAIDMKKITHIQVNRETKKKLRQVLDKIYDSSVGINLKSKHFLDQMDRWKLD
ncbi:DNA recombination and repair protein RecO [Fructilactobacillus florum 8D]|uniref:DNA repair protein RecO n=1 Tax=Fructilactobacillus florum 8D TaxID=1221538 RepID=W9EIP3_9LACO|nr:DNA repair protein RecO [Fructilactobacillus florum]ETO40875.1 DNA recombination and repair protein RecO [Fructilactobacillus florum 8D]